MNHHGEGPDRVDSSRCWQGDYKTINLSTSDEGSLNWAAGDSGVERDCESPILLVNADSLPAVAAGQHHLEVGVRIVVPLGQFQHELPDPPGPAGQVAV